VEYLARQIRSGEWQPDHPQPLIFSDKRMIDGQHRCWAVIKAGIPITVTVKMGVRDELREYIDTGISRNLEDRVLFSNDDCENKHIAQLINGMHIFQARRRPSPGEALGVWEVRRDAIKWVLKFKVKKQKGVNAVPVCLALIEMFERDAEMADEFAEGLCSADGMIQQARRLREFLLTDKAVNSLAGRAQTKAKCIYAMKAYLEDKTIAVLRSGAW